MGIIRFYQRKSSIWKSLIQARICQPLSIPVTNIETSAQAAEALKPIAGESASLIFTLGSSAPGFLRSRFLPAPPPTPLPRAGVGRWDWRQPKEA
jgi:hypothetical protein